MTYEDWQQRLTALHVAAYGMSADMARKDADDPERADIETLMRRSPMAREIARALGIDTRHKLEWQPTKYLCGDVDEYRAPGVGRFSGFVVDQMDCDEDAAGRRWERWSAWSEGHRDEIFVTGHPSAPSAMEHLECLLGLLVRYENALRETGDTP